MLKIGDACDLRAWRELYFKYWIANNIDSARFLPLWCTFEHTSNYIIYYRTLLHVEESESLNLRGRMNDESIMSLDFVLSIVCVGC